MSESSNSSPSLRLAVVGGGISGLTAAYRLTQLLPQVHVELFEATERLGGILHTRRQDGLLMEQGADSFLGKLPAAVELCRELGLGDEIIPTNETPRRALVLWAGSLHRVPEGFVQMRPERVGPMLRTRLLSWRGKLRLLAERWMSSPPDIQQETFDESVASFATRRLGREVFERLVQPLIAGIYTADPYQLSVAATMPTAIEAERDFGSLVRAVQGQSAVKSTDASSASGARYGSFVTLQGGLGRLVERLSQRLSNVKVHVNASIDRVEQVSGGSWHLTPVDRAEALPFDGVIVALPAPVAGQILTAADVELSRLLQTIPYASSAVVSLVYHRGQISDPLDGFGIVVPTVEGRQIVAASFSSLKFPDRAPADEVLIRVFLGGALQPQLLQQTDSQLVDLAAAEMKEILGIVGTPQRTELVRWQQKMPQYHVGHVQLVDQIECRVAKHWGLELAGNAYRGVGIPQCVASGDSAARRLVGQLVAGELVAGD